MVLKRARPFLANQSLMASTGMSCTFLSCWIAYRLSCLTASGSSQATAARFPRREGGRHPRTVEHSRGLVAASTTGGEECGAGSINVGAGRRFRPPSCGSLASWSACLLDCRHGGMSSAESSFRRQRQMARILPRSDAPTSFASLECRMGTMKQYVRQPIRATTFLVLNPVTLAVGRC